MDILWQQIVIGIVLTGAIAYLVRRAIRRPDRKGTCTRCHCNKKSILDRRDLKRL